jgi:hypothetical protein
MRVFASSVRRSSARAARTTRRLAFPKGSRALAGIGCHGMAMLMPARRTTFGTHMGGEGATWIGQAPFTTEAHVFVNLGDGTYQHSGLLAIRAAAAAASTSPYKILYNDAVAMTGGQPVDGRPGVADIARQVAAEGAKKIVVVAEDPDKYRGASSLAAIADIRHRRDLDSVQRELRATPGLTVLIYDQVCAAGAAPTAQARHRARAAGAHRDQRRGLRRLRRLLRAVELHRDPAARHRIRTQAHDRSVELQSRSELCSEDFVRASSACAAALLDGATTLPSARATIGSKTFRCRNCRR